MRKILFIGGTGTISAAIVRQLVADGQWEVTVLNRGNRADALPEQVKQLKVDINDEDRVRELTAGVMWDAVAEFIGFVPSQVERDVRLFAGKTRQYVYISSSSAYNKPCRSYLITEGTTLANPYWQYSRDKIACEEYLMREYRENGFPVTIVRPSHTYDERSIPVGVQGKNGSWQVIDRIRQGKPVIIQGDGTSLWTLTFNRDFASGYIGLLGNPHAIGEAVQITGDETLTWNQIYETIAQALGVELHALRVPSDFLAEVGAKYGYDYAGELLGDKARSVVFDNTKLKRLSPGMKTTVPFDEGVRIALDNILAHPELQRADPEFDEFTDKVVAAFTQAKSVL